MIYLQNEILNLILSYREVNPTAKLIRKSIDDYKNSVTDSYYKHAILRVQSKTYYNGMIRLQEKYQNLYQIIESKKYARKMRLKKQTKLLTRFLLECEKYEIAYEDYCCKNIPEEKRRKKT